MTERKNYWQAEHIVLRLPNMADVDQVVADYGRRDTEAESFAGEMCLPRSSDGCRANWERIVKEGAEGDNCSLLICNLEGTLCGFLNVFGTSQRHGSFSYGISMLSEVRGKGYAAEAVNLLLDYYFNHLRYHRCGINVYGFNPRSIRFHEKLGFRKCGEMHEVIYYEGKYHDQMLYEMTAEQFNQRNRGECK